MKVTVLGSGLTVTDLGLDYRYPASHLVEAGGKKILLDVSIGTLPQLSKLELKPTDISTVCISHYHADHFAIEPFLQAFYILAKKTSEKIDLRIIGPSDIERRVRDGMKVRNYSFDNDILQYINLVFEPYEDGKAAQLSKDVSVTPFKTVHSTLEAYTLRVESGGKVIAYSGDSSATRALEKVAKDSDVFLCEAAFVVGRGSNDTHVNPHDAGLVAKKAGAKQLVLVHYSGHDDPATMIDDVKSSGFDGQVDVAWDLSVYKTSK